MSHIRTEEKIVDELEFVKRKLMEFMVRLTGVENTDASAVTQDLNQLVRKVVQLKADVHGRFKSQREKVDALTNVGDAINSSLGLKPVLNNVMEALISLMNAESGFLMLKDEGGEFQVEIVRDSKNRDLSEKNFPISRSIVRRVVEKGEAVLTSNAQEDPRFGQQASIAALHLLSILCAPLKVKDDLIGVIYVENSAQTGTFHADDRELISAFANQAAVAIENARLFENLQASNKELQEAYAATLEGWVRALDLRDKETEGHTRRVTAITGELARSMGLDEDALIHIKRGALLHDIGKMAIPDGILLKPAALTQEERTLIQKHPDYAFEMLTPIKFLNPALDIPYCHHEKWDGSGYPRGLKGENIPLAARIFAVVDVWDALVSDRPYRKGLKPAEVKEKIRDDAGTHFDPVVVDAFLGLDDQILRATTKVI